MLLPGIIAVLWFYYEEKERLEARHRSAMFRHENELNPWIIYLLMQTNNQDISCIIEPHESRGGLYQGSILAASNLNLLNQY